MAVVRYESIWHLVCSICLNDVSLRLLSRSFFHRQAEYSSVVKSVRFVIDCVFLPCVSKALALASGT